jgi:peptide-methionine (S)-S-oxide reductase
MRPNLTAPLRYSPRATTQTYSGDMGRFGSLLRSALLGSAATLPSAERALPGRDTPLDAPEFHHVHPDRRIQPPFPPGLSTAVFGMGCFWGAERLFWQTPGVHSTATGYAGGHTPNPTYGEVCSGRTAHAEVVLVVFDPAEVTYPDLLRLFWENHNPTQGMRQGNDLGTQYRSALYPVDEPQLKAAESSRDAYRAALTSARHRPEITTEIAPLRAFYYAEPRHQQYLAKIPNGYCAMAGTGVACPTPT